MASIHSDYLLTTRRGVVMHNRFVANVWKSLDDRHDAVLEGDTGSRGMLVKGNRLCHVSENYALAWALLNAQGYIRARFGSDPTSWTPGMHRAIAAMHQQYLTACEELRDEMRTKLRFRVRWGPRPEQGPGRQRRDSLYVPKIHAYLIESQSKYRSLCLDHSRLSVSGEHSGDTRAAALLNGGEVCTVCAEAAKLHEDTGQIYHGPVTRHYLRRVGKRL